MDANEHELIIKEDVPSAEITQHRNLTILQKIVALFAGFLLPIAAFWLGAVFKPEWQSKTLESYVSMLLTPNATWAFWPLIFYSMITLTMVLFIKQASQNFLVRVGIYIGILWSFQYVVVLPLAIGHDESSFNTATVTLFGVVAILIPIGLWFAL